ncbi:ribbon-helix-helix protein, CopG family [Pararhodospirillum oryzae]|uniref:Ribbon-helix-helix protein CopG domain-containing protein n=1 Tax=Pararhodospirillum oryzae TaxID=478448 RepID=A0A512H4P5_9PROT|nr:ribbon-helix-helix protein, CopG family [Pararhodospirillum oryzae]GEO80350.1 hypothetical protein ROR02_04810 [Pararhodospirillum oryzae]
MDHTLAFTIPEDLYHRLSAMAEQAGQGLDACLRQALQSHVDAWEEYQRTVAALQEGEPRPVLKVVNE